MANISKKDRMEKFANEVEKRDQDTFYFSPPGYSPSPHPPDNFNFPLNKMK